MRNCTIFAVSNQKGGVGKTTTSFSMAVALARSDKKVLLVDADPQGDLTSYMGYYDLPDNQKTIAELMDSEMKNIAFNPKEAILHHQENVDLIPSDINFSVLETTLIGAMSREHIMRKCLEPLKKDYDAIIIDCMPSLAIITINALSCADQVIIPVETHYLAAKGMGHLLNSVASVKRNLNPNLKVAGVLFTLVDNRTNISKEVQDTIKNEYGNIVKVFNTTIPFAIKTAESTSQGKSIFSYDKNSKVSEAYSSFIKELGYGETKEKNATSKSYCR